MHRKNWLAEEIKRKRLNLMTSEHSVMPDWQDTHYFPSSNSSLNHTYQWILSQMMFDDFACSESFQYYLRNPCQFVYFMVNSESWISLILVWRRWSILLTLLLALFLDWVFKFILSNCTKWNKHCIDTKPRPSTPVFNQILWSLHRIKKYCVLLAPNSEV